MKDWFHFKMENKKPYKVFGKSVVEVAIDVEAENEEEAIKIANSQILYVDSCHLDIVSCDEPVNWTYAEEYDEGCD